ncbi:MAG: hypothetical protein JNM93_00190 [Bacteriovoracaceae bacterium]|nr:hypothetical protein [Bacteriovoracaceae bacterium]
MEDIIKSIKSILYERVSSPLAGAFLVSFVIINWRIPLILIYGDDTSSSRIWDIELYLSKVSICYLLFFPLLSTILFICVFPYFSNLAFEISQWWGQKTLKIRNKYEDTERLSVEQSLKIRLELKNQQTLFQEMLESKEKELENLRTKTSPELEDSLTLNEKAILEAIGVIQKKFKLLEVIIIRETGRIHFDNDRLREKEINIYKHSNAHTLDEKNPNELKEVIYRLSPKYISLLPSARMRAPYEVTLTDEGRRYLESTSELYRETKPGEGEWELT